MATDSKAFTSIKDLGISCDANPRYRPSMEDTHYYEDNYRGDPSSGYFGVYDGHGGKEAADYVAEHLHKNLANCLDEGLSVKDAFKKAFVDTDNEIGAQNIHIAGTTVAVALIKSDEAGVKTLYTANCGDARIVLAENGTGVRVSRDHKPSDPSENQRIQAAGGFVILQRVNGILAVARSLGDRSLKDFVTGEPDTFETKLTDAHTHLIIACDGLWDVISDNDAVNIVSKYESSQEASKALLDAALAAGSTDNISIMVLKL